MKRFPPGGRHGEVPLINAALQGLTLVSLSAQLKHLRVHKRDELSGTGTQLLKLI
jgi:hypothetical protein